MSTVPTERDNDELVPDGDNAGLVPAMLGRGLAAYLKLVVSTSRFRFDPPGFLEQGGFQSPMILAAWHGQQLLTYVANQQRLPIAALVAKHGDGQLIGVAFKRLGIGLVHGSGTMTPGRQQRKGGARAFRQMVTELAGGRSIGLTADVPKLARVVGRGVVKLAQYSGCPIYPVLVATSRRIVLDTWDRATVPLPFSRGVVALGAPIRVGKEASESEVEEARLRLQANLDETAARAFRLLALPDPGMGLRPAP